MAQVRQMLKHVHVESAKGRRACRRNRNHLIARGSPCLVIRDDGAPFTRTYCQDCALPILKRCAADLRLFRDTLYGRPGTEHAQPDAETDKQPATEPAGKNTEGVLEADSFHPIRTITGTDG